MSNIQNGLENSLNKNSVLRWLNTFDTATTINKEIIEHIVTGEHCCDLVVQNDKKFKIFPKTEANPTESAKNPTEEVVAVGNKKNNCKDISKEILDESSFKIQCKIEEKPQHIVVNTVPNVNDVNIDFLHESNDDVSVKDLQTLLIMMAISSKTNNTDDVNPIESENYDEKQVAVNKCAMSLTSQQLKTEEMDDILNITPIKITLEAKHEMLARKYLENWKEYIRRKKDYVAQQRELTLNKFLGKLAKKKIDIDKSIVSHNKAKLIARDYSTYQHRYKMQKHVIAFQKAKLEEQNRLIEELKYNKILEASRDSVDAMRDEIRNTYFEINRHLKPKIKCLTNELKIPEIDASALVLQCLKVPQFLQRMEKRAREREEKHALIRERRRQMEEERIRLKQQAELAKAEMDKEEKMKRMKELREKRKREKIDNIRKKQFVERMRALTVMADLHYEKHLLSKYGIRPWKKLLEIKKENTEKANVHYKFQLKKNVFLHFMWYTEDMWFERTFKAVEFYRKNILRKAFEGLKKNHHDYILKKQVAEDYYDLYVTQLVFRHFKKCTQILKKENELKLHKAVSYHNWNIIFKAFTCWRTLPALNALKREQEARKARWREKVLQVVPDYAPPDD